MLSSTSCARSYAGTQVENPTASPLLAPIEVLLDAIPPAHITVSNSEVLMSDGVRMHRKLRDAGVYAAIDRYKDEVHVFPVFNSREGTHGGDALAACVRHMEDCFSKRQPAAGGETERVIDRSALSLRSIGRQLSSITKRHFASK